jgi:hypothetical protein
MSELVVEKLDLKKIREEIAREKINLIPDSYGVKFVRDINKNLNRHLPWSDLSPDNLARTLVHHSVKTWWSYDIGLELIKLSNEHFGTKI